MIDRRNAIAGIVAMFGASLYGPLARAATGNLAGISEGPPSGPVFTAEQRALMTALSERIMPTTDTPGAIAAGVPEFIEKLLADWALPDEKGPIIAGLVALDARSRSDFGVPASKATAQQHDTLLEMAMANRFPGAIDFFEHFRQLVIAGYFTSEIGMTVEREYLPVPGRYDGAYPYAEIKKVFSS